MPSRRQTPAEEPVSKRRPATTPEDRERQLIALAVDRAEQQIIDGTVSAQVLTHYLKLGSTREKLEIKRIDYETKLLEAKAQQLASMSETKELYENAIRAMGIYSGNKPLSQDDYDEDNSVEYYDG